MEIGQLLDELRAAGLPVAAGEVVEGSASAVRAARRLGFPVVLKACGLDHKSDTGGVVIGLVTPDAVASAAERLQRDLGASADRLLVQRQMHGFEIIVGARREPGVGAAVMVGAGGVLAELLEDTATALLPLAPGEARSLLGGLRISPVLTGYRGEPYDVEALVELVEKVADLVGSRGDVGELDLNPVIVGREGEGVAVVDARLVTAEQVEETAGRLPPDLSPLFNPRHVVVVGVSDDGTKTASRIFRHLVEHGFPGRLDPVHPDGGEIEGRRRYRSLQEVPGRPDLVSVAVPASAVSEVVEAAASKGVGCVIVHSSGFAETGEAGRALQDRVAATLSSAGIPLVGPNDMGIVSPPSSLAASLSGGLDRPLVAGSIALVASSGALGSCLATRLMNDGHGLSRWIHLGNEAGLDAADYMSWLADDDETTVVGLLLESIANGDGLVEAGGALLASGKPAFAYLMARSAAGRAAVATHTGALLGSHGLREAVAARAGITTVPTLRALEDALVLASRGDLPRGSRVAALTASGGACTIIADEAAGCGLELPELSGAARERIAALLPGFVSVRNPVDLTAQLLSDDSRFAAVLATLADERHFDVVLVQLTTNADPGAEAIARAVVDARQRVGIPVVVSRYGSPSLAPRALAVYAQAGVPLLDSPDRAVQAVAALVRAGMALEGHRAG